MGVKKRGANRGWLVLQGFPTILTGSCRVAQAGRLGGRECAAQASWADRRAQCSELGGRNITKRWQRPGVWGEVTEKRHSECGRCCTDPGFTLKTCSPAPTSTDLHTLSSNVSPGSSWLHWIPVDTTLCYKYSMHFIVFFYPTWILQN